MEEVLSFSGLRPQSLQPRLAVPARWRRCGGVWLAVLARQSWCDHVRLAVLASWHQRSGFWLAMLARWHWCGVGRGKAGGQLLVHPLGSLDHLLSLVVAASLCCATCPVTLLSNALAPLTASCPAVVSVSIRCRKAESTAASARV